MLIILDNLNLFILLGENVGTLSRSNRELRIRNFAPRGIDYRYIALSLIQKWSIDMYISRRGATTQ